MILSIYIKIISKEKILKYAATSMFLYINILSSLEKKKKILAIKNENEKVTVKISYKDQNADKTVELSTIRTKEE